MTHNFYKPNPRLRNFIKFYWSLYPGCLTGKTKPIRVIPSGLIELTFYLGNQVTIVDHHGSKLLTANATICGQRSNYFDYQTGEYSGVFSAAIKPAGAKSIFGLPINELFNQHVDFNDLLGKEGKELTEKISSAKTDLKRISLIEEFLEDNIIKNYSPNLRINEFEKQAAYYGGVLKITESSNYLNISKRQLERNVKEELGTTPKEFLKIIRLQNTLSLKQKSPGKNLTQLAYEAGYSDQAHFTNDFKKYTGLTPRDFFSQCIVFSDYYASF